MARVLIATVPATGHIAPLLPIARALCQRGDRVRWLSGQKHAQRIRDTGAEWIPYPELQDVDESQLDEVYPARKKLKGLAGLKHDIKHIFFDPALPMLRDLRTLAAREPFDLMISDIAYIGSQLHHELTGTPLIVVNVSPLTISGCDVAPFGFALPPAYSRLGHMRNRALHALLRDVIMRDVNAYFHKIRSEVGLSAKGWFLDTHERTSVFLQPTVPAFEYPRSDLPANVHFIGLLPAEYSQQELPAWLRDHDPQRPLVHVTQGTIANRVPQLIEPTLQGLAREQVTVVATTGGRTTAELGLRDIPRNAHVVPFIPYDRLLPRTDVVLSNGGYGGVQQALQHGIPIAIAGATEDKPEVAARVAYCGAGIDMRTAKPTPRHVQRTVRALLDDAQFRTNAQRMRDEYARYDALKLALQHVDTLLGRAN